jgi:hypothetical protein
VFELSDAECHALVDFIIDRFGTGLSELDFVDCVLLLFEDIPGLEQCNAQSHQSMLDSLWRLYCDQRS